MSIQSDFLPVPDIFNLFLQRLTPALWPGEGERHCLSIRKVVL